MSATRLQQLQLWLAEAELAKQQLAIGKQVITLSYSAEGSNMQQFAPGNIDALKAHILELKAEIASLTGIGTRRPIYFA